MQSLSQKKKKIKNICGQENSPSLCGFAKPDE